MEGRRSKYARTKAVLKERESSSASSREKDRKTDQSRESYHDLGSPGGIIAERYLPALPRVDDAGAN